MRRDKGSLKYFQDETQRVRCRRILNQVCEKTFLSFQDDPNSPTFLPRTLLDEEGWQPSQLIPDQIKNLGPASGILSAHQQYPTAAWLVVACDFPYADLTGIQFLCLHRNPTKAATVFRNAISVEPLLSIWELHSLTALEKNCQMNHLSPKASPRRTLELLDCEVLDPPQPELLTNINTLEEFAHFSFT